MDHNFLVIMRALKKDPSLRKTSHGICYNLEYWYRFSIQDNAALAKEHTHAFIKDAFTHIYGKYLPFPIEGDADDACKLHHKTLNKWDNSKYGKARLELLDKMIEYAELIEEQNAS